MIDHLFKRLSLALVGLLTFAFCFLTLPFSSAEDKDTIVDDVIITVPAACSIKDSTGGAGKTYNVSMMPGQYNPNIGSTTIVATCNDASGFALYAIGYGNEEYGNTDLITNLANPGASGTNTGNIVTGTATSGGTSNWAMKLSTQTNPAPTYPIVIQNGFGNFSAVPSTYTLVAKRTSATDAGTGAEGARLNTHYAVYVSPTQVAATYTGKVKYTMVHPASEVPLQPQTPTAGCINYFANASDAVGTMGCQSATDNASVTLLASNFSRTGYGFAGWSDAFDYATNANANFYGPQETITAPVGTTANGLSLYAVWVKSEGNIQSWNGCSTLTKADEATNIFSQSITALSDQRDNNTYAVAKLADGNCWMIENLRLDNSATLTTVNTNNPLNDGTNVTLKHSYSDTETYNTLSASQDPTATTWCRTNAASCDDQSMLFTGNTTDRKTDSADNSGNIYSYGNYYNWYSATAGRGTYSFGTSNNSVAGDLCPTGWHLPIGGSSANATNSDFWQLGLGIMGATPSNNSNYQSSETNTVGKTATAAFRSYPNNFVYSGYVNISFVYSRGSDGHYWSSTVLSSNYAYYLSLNSSTVNPGTNYGSKYSGRTVRCVVSGV